MPRSTTAFHNRIALAFDFDETLAPSTFPRVVQSCGWDPDSFVQERVDPLVEQHGWEWPLATTFALTEALSEEERSLTESDLAQIGRDFPLFDGVEEMFERVREAARAIAEDVEVYFYLITAGFAEVPQNTSIASEFEAIYGGAYHFDEDGNLRTAKRIVTHPEKELYLMQIAKGVERDGANPVDVVRPRDPSDWFLPVDQMIFVGDGASDLPAFRFVQERGGIAIGIHESSDAEDWEERERVHGERRVENLAPNDYSEGSELLQSLVLATESIAKRVALRRLGRGE